MDIGIASRPLPGFKVNGDSYRIERNGRKVFIAVIDGIGHGQPAAEASDAALECLESCGYDQKLFYQICHQKLLGTRGIVAATMLIDEDEEIIEYSGVGNIEASVCTDNRSENLYWRYGIIGDGPAVRTNIRRAYFPPGSILVVHSDGISGKFKLDDYYGLKEQSAQFIADVLLRDWGRTTDDATVVVIRREVDNGS